MNDENALDDAPLPALLRHARRTYGQAMRAALARQGIEDVPPGGLYAIGLLAFEEAGLTTAEIARHMGLSRQGVIRLGDALAAGNYVRRTPGKTVLTLTERGQLAASIQMEARMVVDAQLLGAVGEEDVAATRRVLAALIGMRDG